MEPGAGMTGLELVAGFLGAWAVRKARRVGGRLDQEFDAATDAGLERLHDVIAARLGEDPALAKLEEEASHTGEVSDRTARRVTDAVDDAAEGNPGFADELRDAVAKIQEALAARPAGAEPHPAVTMTARVSGHGRAYQAARDMNIHE
jgi:hypothetical protein